MAVTHDDLTPKIHNTDLGSKRGVSLIILTILCGLFCFILCLFAEANRSEVTWTREGSKGKESAYLCVYSGSGATPLLCGGIAFVGLAVAMMVEHTFILIAVSETPHPSLVSLELDSSSARKLTWQVGFFFIATWICFAVGEILLLIALSVESGHLKNWSRPRQSCLIIQQGIFTAAGVLAMLTVFLAAGFYLTILQAQRILQELDIVRRQVMETSALYSSPPPSPQNHVTTVPRENPVAREIQQGKSSFAYHLAFNKA